MKVTVVSSSAQALKEISSILGEGDTSRTVTCHQRWIGRLSDVAKQERPDVMIIEGLCRDFSELAPIELMTTKYPGMIVIMLCSQQSSAFLINAMRVGVHEVVLWPATKITFEAVMGRAARKLGGRST